MHVTGQDFPNYSSSEGAPSDCSDEAWPSHSLVEEDVGLEVTLLVGWPDLVGSFPRGESWQGESIEVADLILQLLDLCFHLLCC